MEMINTKIRKEVERECEIDVLFIMLGVLFFFIADFMTYICVVLNSVILFSLAILGNIVSTFLLIRGILGEEDYNKFIC